MATQKTPVSILQELMVKNNCVPNYELIHDGGGTHENTFTYQVSCQGLAATGTGRCKKDAKHLAAKNMLDKIAKQNGYLPLPASPAESPVRTPVPMPMPQPHIHPVNEPFNNDIGELKDLCAEHELPEPEYQTVSDIGPPHARIFTIHCIVSNFVVEGVGTTKKTAKHLAARKMHERLKELISQTKSTSIFAMIDEGDNALPKKSSVDTVKCPHESELESIYNKLSTHPKHLGVRPADYHTKLRDSYPLELRQEVISKLNELQSGSLASSFVLDVTEFEDDVLTKLKEILSLLNVTAKNKYFKLDNDEHLLAVYLTTIPEIVMVANGMDELELIKFVYNNIIDTLRLRLS